MEINLEELDVLTILHGLAGLHDKAKEYREVVYDNQKDFIIDLNSIRSLHNQLLVQAQHEGMLEEQSFI